MVSQKPKLLLKMLLVIFTLSFAVAACNNSSNKTETTDTTTMKSADTMSTAPMDTMPKMDTTKMDTGTTRPVKEVN
jgi:hypothetical protein